MKKYWSEAELSANWSLSSKEYNLTISYSPKNRLSVATQIKYFQIEGKFPSRLFDIPTVPIEYLAQQLNINSATINKYDWKGRSYDRHRQQIRSFLGYRTPTAKDAEAIADSLKREILPFDHNPRHSRESAIDWCRHNFVELPSEGRLERIIRSAAAKYEKELFENIHDSLSTFAKEHLAQLLQIDHPDSETTSNEELMSLNELKADPGGISLKSVLKEISKLKCIERLELPEYILSRIPVKVLYKYKVRTATEPPNELRQRKPAVCYALVTIFCWQRKKEIIDGLIDLLIQIIHRIAVRAEKKLSKNC